ncbi:MAG: cardiolipin synthase [Roseobacter sp.]|jgi:cardiolipin synthase|nr:cardiolipin synthase [Roseobacter sp.]
MLVFLAIGHALVVVAFTARILLRDDLSPPARLAWFIVINLVPYLGSASYFLFGEVDVGHRASAQRKQISEDLRQIVGDVAGEPGASRSLIHESYAPAFRYAASINGFNPVAGNKAELMGTPAETVERMVQDIDQATDHVHVLYYIWLDDQTGTSLAEALIRACARGVTCRAMADGLGSRALIASQLWDRMKNAGVQLAVSLPLDKPLLTLLTSRIDLRNHRKITVVDGAITYCGSRNSADPEFRPKPKFAPWVDIMLRFEGPVVAQNQLLFLGDWMAATGEVFENVPSKTRAFERGFPALAIGDGPTIRRAATPQLFCILIACARDEITISTPYFVPDATLLDALCTAAHRGVRVTLVFPAQNDSWIVAAASRSYYRRLLEAGCSIHEYYGGLLHAKTFVMDHQVSMIGSSNLDLRSFDLNYENNILFQDHATSQSIRARQEEYIAHSEPVGLSDVLGWSRPQRIWQNVVATVGPIL